MLTKKEKLDILTSKIKELNWTDNFIEEIKDKNIKDNSVIPLYNKKCEIVCFLNLK